ncbi:hypothetical protein FOMPIDRAFT_1050677 [Fomitopsis schrenkii]|uniref:Uncharacterized protein n=1 Tax=Fomitopsis schrenkii TaxID=2126942 RepID=S8FCW3_FOMSC|nr:hypothetical protein FOMPIDRAFT_1050677 [Fomitopsis schrenkii]
MVKSREEVIAKFNEYVNMNADELKTWLDDPQSTKAGTGVGLESGHKIIEILKKNPDKDPEKYDEEDLEHMRKVVSYNARHLAQEDKLKETKTKEELENTKSTISLKNWGHDPIKTLDGDENATNDGVDESTTKDGEGKCDDVKPNNSAPKASVESKDAKESVPKEPAVEGKSGSKRKLGQDSEKPTDTEAEEASKEVGGYEDESEDVSGDATVEEEPGRSRKRTKTAEEGEKSQDE